MDDLHHSVWTTYRRAIGADVSWDAAAAFQAAVDVLLSRQPGVDPRSACDAAARMIMTRPRGMVRRGIAGGLSVRRPRAA